MTAPAPTLSNPRPRNRRRRLLRTVLLRFLKRLRKVCATLETPAQWYEVTKELRQTLFDYRDVLSPADRDSLWLATMLTDQTHTGITQACNVLQSKLVSVIAALPAAGLAAPILIAGALVVAGAVAVGAIALNASSVGLSIQNVGCEPIAVTGLVPISAPGLELPNFVPTDTISSAQIPPVTITTQFQPPRDLQVNLFGAPLRFGLPSQIRSATLEGADLLTGTHTFDLGQSRHHTLVVRCR